MGISLYDYCIQENTQFLLEEWAADKNGDLTPKDFVRGSHKKVWWRCDKGHEWQARVFSRAQGCGCPVCAGKTVLAGENDLATSHPHLVAEWHATKNAELTPQLVNHGSRKVVWWQCSKGHEWQSSVKQRTTNRSNCPYCAGTKILVGFNDLRTTHPELASQWHPDLNGSLTPEMVSKGSGKKVWWLCGKGHEWQSTVLNRANGNDCPACAGRVVLPGVNDLASCKPLLAREWHPTLNGELYPEDVTLSSSEKVWWLCQCGCEWQATVSARSNNNTGCPTCAASWRRKRRDLG